MNLNGTAPQDALFQKQSEMAERVKALDWSQTPLGPIDTWPQSLRMAVGICLNSRFPMFVWWGPDLINLYNDAYAPILGQRHPDALGKPAREIWAELWPVIGDEVDAVIQRGEAVSHERMRLVLERNGYPEETYFTYSHSPIPNEHGGIGGLFQVCSDETAQVRAEQERDRMAAQRQLALDAAHMGWWHYDPRTKIATWDDRYKEIFGVMGYQRPNDEILARIHPDDLPGVWAAVEAALDPINPQPYAAEYRIYREEGKVCWIEAHGIATFEGEGRERRATSFVGTVADITDRKHAQVALLGRTEEIASLNTRLQRMMTETHHRVKNNLQVIAALAEMQAEEGGLVPVSALERVGQHVRSLAAIHDLLTHQSKEALDGAEGVDAKGLLERLMPLLQATAGGRSVQMHCGDLWLPTRYAAAVSVLINELVSNALKHTAGDVEVILMLTEQRPEGQERRRYRRVRLEVSDEGAGFPIGFDPDRAAHTGLELVQMLARHDLQGEAHFANRSEGGACVTILFSLNTDIV